MNYAPGLQQLDIDLSNLKRSRTTCPQCSDSRRKSHDRCLWVSLETGAYKCHHCGWEGRADSSEWMNRENDEPMQQVKTYDKPEDKYRDANGVGGDYLQSRGITMPVIKRNRIGETSGEVVFRYYQGNELIRAKIRSVRQKKFWQVANCAPVLYKLDDINGEDACIITEGELDALSWEVAGYQGAVSLPDGAVQPGQNPGAKFEALVHAKPLLDSMRAIFISMDADDPGQYTAVKLAEFLGVNRCWKVVFPDDCKDANDVLTKHGVDMLRTCLKRAKKFELDEVVEADPLLRKALATRFDYDTQVEKIPAVLTVENKRKEYEVGALGQIGIFSGHEKSGKSFLLECIAASAIGGGHRKVGFSMSLGDKKLVWFDTEQSAYFYHLNQRRLHNLAGVHGNTPFYEAYHLRKFTAPERIEIIEKILYASKDIGAVVIDGFVDLMLDYNNLEETQLLVSRLMRWTDELNILLMGVLHLNKGDGRLRGHIGSELKNKCDFQITVTRDEEVYTVKNMTNRYLTFPSFTFSRSEDGMPEVDEYENAPF